MGELSKAQSSALKCTCQLLDCHLATSVIERVMTSRLLYDCHYGRHYVTIDTFSIVPHSESF